MQSSKKINKGGMGLGLTISKLILQELKGNISVMSEFGKGTRFSFFIPLEREESSSEDETVQQEKFNVLDSQIQHKLVIN